MTELVPCPLCGGSEGYSTYPIDSNPLGTNGHANVLVCDSCNRDICECESEDTDTAWNEAGAYAEGLRVERDAAIAQRDQAHKEFQAVWKASGAINTESDRMKAINGELVEVLMEAEKYLSGWRCGDAGWPHNHIAAKARAVIAKVEG